MSARKNARYRRLLQGARTRIRDLITESWYRVAASSANVLVTGQPLAGPVDRRVSALVEKRDDA